MNILKNWLSSNPVRVYLYAVATALVGLLVALGVVTSDTAVLVMGVVAAVLAVPVTESLRSRVTPVSKE